MADPVLGPALEAMCGKAPPNYRLTRLAGDASTRVYYRLTFAADAVAGTDAATRTGTDAATGADSKLPASLIVMQLPEDAFKSDEGGSGVTGEELPFVEVADLLAARDLPVPRIYAKDLAHHVLLLEDLGDVTFEARLLDTERANWATPYGDAVDLMASLHERCATLPPTSIVTKRAFDEALLAWELDHFREWGLVAPFGPLNDDDAATVTDAFARITETILAFPQGFVHRDYQSRNLMRRQDGTLALIDFQDALVGPRVYDLVALLCDSYVSLDEPLQRDLINRYARARGANAVEIENEFWWVAVHRKLKDAGRFVYIDRVRGNPGFLKWYPQSLVYVDRALSHLSELADLRALLTRAIPGFPDAVGVPASISE